MKQGVDKRATWVSSGREREGRGEGVSTTEPQSAYSTRSRTRQSTDNELKLEERGARQKRRWKREMRTKDEEEEGRGEEEERKGWEAEKGGDSIKQAQQPQDIVRVE